MNALQGKRIRLIYCGDPYTQLKSGLEGTITMVDAVGTLHVRWDDGHQLGLIPDEDKYELIADSPDPRCIGCGKGPDELGEYVESAQEAEMTPADYLRAEEGTYNPANGHFACTECYIKMGMPSTPTGWRAP